MTHPRRQVLLLVAVGALAAAMVSPAVASAHGLVGRQDLPLPKWLFGWAGVTVLVVSFLGLAALWQRPRLQDVRARTIAVVPRAVEVVCGAIGVGVFAVVVSAGFSGAQSDQDNILPTTVFVLFWIGVPFVSLVLGDVFALFNPWRAVGRAAGWIVSRFGAPPEPLAYPERLGRWPAAVGILAFAWVELAYPDNTDPSQLGVLALVYAGIQLIGMSLYGERTWSARGDGFGVYFGLIARLSPFEWSDRRLKLRTPLSGEVGLDMLPGTVALICVAIGTTSFDGFSQGATWNSIQQWAIPKVTELGFNAEHATEIVWTIGIMAAVGIVAGLYRLGIQGIRGVDRTRDATTLSRLFGHTLVPIALAYVVAHYFSLLAYQGQAAWRLASDPLGRGSDIFGTATATIDYTWVTATGIWYIQVAALVMGHVAGLVLAHDRAIAMYDDPRTATRSQLWMLGVMVSFTCLALYLLTSTD